MAAAEAVEGYCKGQKGRKHVLVLAGIGNNGGDGLAAARLLAELGYQVEVWCVGNRSKASEEWRRQMGILEKYPVEFTEMPQRTEYTVMLDGLLGVGLSRAVAGVFEEAVRVFNRLEGWKLALDLPSGVDSDTGKIWGCAVKADMTVTFGFCKRGLMLYPGHNYAGEVMHMMRKFLCSCRGVTGTGIRELSERYCWRRDAGTWLEQQCWQQEQRIVPEREW